MGATPVAAQPAARRAAGLLVGVLVGAVALSGCGLFGGDDKPGRDVSVFDLKPGDCLVPQTEVRQELAKVRVVSCKQPHTQEAYAVVRYERPTTGATGAVDADNPNAYPGDAVLKKFADGLCAQRYGDYVGVDYPDSSLFFTYLLPSARGWQQKDDRNVVCFVTTTGASLKASVKGSRQ